MNESQATFQVTYDGPALAQHTMDVRDLAPALLSLSNLIDESGRLLYGPETNFKVHVKNVGDGCFMTELAVLMDSATTLLNHPRATAGLTLLAYLGVVSGAGRYASVSLLNLIKRLKGNHPVVVEISEEKSMALLEFENHTFEVPLEVLRLYEDIPVRSAFSRVVEPLGKEGIVSIEFKAPGQPKSEAVIIDRLDRESFAVPAIGEEEMSRDIRIMPLSIVSVVFKDDNKWRFFDGNATVYASIEDAAFMNQVNMNQISFAKDDVLICKVEVVSTRSSKGLATTYSIKEVVERKPAMRQLKLEYSKKEPPAP